MNLSTAIARAKSAGLHPSAAITSCTEYRLNTIMKTPVSKLTPGGTAIGSYRPGSSMGKVEAYLISCLGEISEWYGKKWGASVFNDIADHFLLQHIDWSLSDIKIWTAMVKRGEVCGERIEAYSCPPAKVAEWMGIYSEWKARQRQIKTPIDLEDAILAVVTKAAEIEGKAPDFRHKKIGALNGRPQTISNLEMGESDLKKIERKVASNEKLTPEETHVLRMAHDDRYFQEFCKKAYSE